MIIAVRTLSMNWNATDMTFGSIVVPQTWCTRTQSHFHSPSTSSCSPEQARGSWWASHSSFASAPVANFIPASWLSCDRIRLFWHSPCYCCAPGRCVWKTASPLCVQHRKSLQLVGVETLPVRLVPGTWRTRGRSNELKYHYWDFDKTATKVNTVVPANQQNQNACKHETGTNFSVDIMEWKWMESV